MLRLGWTRDRRKHKNSLGVSVCNFSGQAPDPWIYLSGCGKYVKVQYTIQYTITTR